MISTHASLSADFEVSRGDTTLRCALEVSGDSPLALVGPNGSGKSTLLHVLAGLLRIDRGKIDLRHEERGAEVLDELGTGRFLAPEDRGFGYVFQDARLFPHLDVLDNVSYGLRARGRPRREARSRARALLQELGCEALHTRRGDALSGGEAQKVALARALAIDPRVLLLDEPLAAVDSTAKVDLRATLRRALAEYRGIAVIVTHDVVDAFTLADEVAVLEAGRLVQRGPVEDVCQQPRSRYVADLVGLNFYRGAAREDGILLRGEGTSEGAEAMLSCASELRGAVIAKIHPRAVALYAREPHGSPRNVWQGRVRSVEAGVESVRVRIDAAISIVAEVTPASVRDLELAPGRSVWVSVKATEIRVHPA